ncbi:dihydrodipicolinate synthase family protein [Rhizobium sp.]|jgi:4-hydroxy-tetrahydrodipicolinate synthase|uniref:dihydrodipicolinate synthase family protein n=1 Tax=Rhizobium sp. TaxID=391 RepID=UPI000E91A441|nr:dihydrodipicolinate synthase family protein [Rhizobium sp.]
MKYDRKNAKVHSRATMRGIWAAANTPFQQDGSIDEESYCRNMDHWINDLGIDGLFIAGKQGEFFSMSVDERKRLLELSVKALDGKAQTIMSCSDQNMDVVIDLAKHAQASGADYIVVHAPILHFSKAQDETLIRYYEAIASKVDIGMALWSHPDSGYLMSPQLCSRLADIETVVAIKYSVPREMYAELTRLAGDRILVSTASEEEWLDNVLELNWQLYLCSSPPYTLQTKADRRMRDYTDLAFAGKADEAKAVSAKLQPVRDAFRRSKPAEKPYAHQKYWQELLGQVGGPVRAPLLELTEDEKRKTREAFENSGLKLS